jgi:hypothetical protein
MEKLINTEGSTLVISEAKISDSGVYVCTGSNSIYVDTDNAKLIVNESMCIATYIYIVIKVCVLLPILTL